MEFPISVIGIGRLGLSLSLTLERKSFDVVGVDLNQEYVDSLNEGFIETPEPKVQQYLKESTMFRATTNLKEALDHSKYIFCVVATNTLEDGHYDHTVIDKLAEQIMQYDSPKERKHLIIQSTTIPGYCKELKEKMQDYNYSISYNPEFIRQGSIIDDQAEPDLVLIGVDDSDAKEFLVDIYRRMTNNEPPIEVMSVLEAEITKLALNCYLTTKISFSSMVGDLCTTVGARPERVLGAIGADERIGPKLLKYGFGYGGTCLPRDNRALSAFANKVGMKCLISDATDLINREHTTFQVNEFVKSTPKGEPISLTGVTFKSGSDIIEESQQLAFAVGVAKAGYDVTIKDSQVVLDEVKSIYSDLFKYEELPS